MKYTLLNNTKMRMAFEWGCALIWTIVSVEKLTAGENIGWVDAVCAVVFWALAVLETVNVIRSRKEEKDSGNSNNKKSKSSWTDRYH